MKNQLSIYTAVLLTVVTSTGLFFCGCAGDRYSRSTGEYIDDNTVKMHVSSALGDNSEYKFEDVKVTVFKGTVQLSGFVNSTDQKSKAGDIARRVQGVHNVENNITIKDRDARTAGQFVDDKGLISRVKGALDNNPEYKFGDVRVSAMSGTIQLSGFVNTSDQKAHAREIARRVEGVKDVENNITVKEKSTSHKARL